MKPPRVPLILRPTPLHRLPRLSAELGIDLWIKRDDLTGFALGGNKGRKLEFLLADMVLQRTSAVVTCGAVHSNFIRQLGAACSIRGIRCIALVMDLPFEPGFEIAEVGVGPGGNRWLNEWLGVEIHELPNGSWDELFAQTEDLAQRLEAEGETVYRIPVGGSSPLGAYAFFEAADEIRTNPFFDSIICPSSSGSTQVGLSYALHGAQTHVIGISCDPEPDLLDELKRLCYGLDDLLGLDRRVAAEYLNLRYDFVGPGYGVPSPDGLAALELMARTEGIFLDPIYTSKAFAGLVQMVRQKEIRGRVLFWHTGGIPSLFTVPPSARIQSAEVAID